MGADKEDVNRQTPDKSSQDRQSVEKSSRDENGSCEDRQSMEKSSRDENGSCEDRQSMEKSSRDEYGSCEELERIHLVRLELLNYIHEACFNLLLKVSLILHKKYIKSQIRIDLFRF